MDEIVKTLQAVQPYGGEGYRFDKIKDSLEDDEMGILYGMAWAVETVKNYCDVVETGIEAIDNMCKEVVDMVLDAVETRLMSELGEIMTSFGDVHRSK